MGETILTLDDGQKALSTRDNLNGIVPYGICFSPFEDLLIAGKQELEAALTSMGVLIPKLISVSQTLEQGFELATSGTPEVELPV